MTLADTTIINEPEGLDLYIDASIGTADPVPTDIVADSTTDFTFRFGFKKKSTPSC